MDDTRREFMRSVGLTMLGLLGARTVAGCKRDGGATSPQDVRAADASSAPPVVAEAGVGGPTEEAVADGVPEAAPAAAADIATAEASGSGLDRVRACWFALLAWQAQENRWEVPQEEREADRDRRKAEHRAAIDAAVEAGELPPAIAERLAIAFDEAVFHVWRSSGGMTCYRMTIVGGRMSESRARILERLKALKELADRGTVPEAAVAESRATLERELVLLDRAADVQQLEGEARREAEQQLVEQIDSGGIASGADDIEAARTLVDLLLTDPTP
jgi:hypothetical protein